MTEPPRDRDAAGAGGAGRAAEPPRDFPSAPRLTVWAIQEVATGCLIGDDKGPKLFADQELNGQPITGELLAKMAATIACEQFNPRPPERRDTTFFAPFRPVPYTSHTTRREPDLVPLRSTLDALIELEGRADD